MGYNNSYLKVVGGSQVGYKGALDTSHAHSALAGGGAGVNLVADLCFAQAAHVTGSSE